MGKRAVVYGATGYMGGELVRLLLGHPEIEVAGLLSRSQAGKRVSEALPFLPSVGDLRLLPESAPVDADIAFLALKAGESMRRVPELLAQGTQVVDLGPDYRLRDPGLYARVYGQAHADPDHLAQAVYGLPELNAEAVRHADLVANPGCYPTASTLALSPLVRRGLLPAHVIIDAKSGTSGAGASPTEATHHPVVAQSVTPYGGGQHRHQPEIEQALGRIARESGTPPPQVTFVPHLVPLVRGLLCSIYAPGVTGESKGAFQEALVEAYASSRFVKVGPVPRLSWVAGSNHCQISVEGSASSLVVFSALDNLVKGGAGQAIQNANLMLGLPEHAGLPTGGLGP